MKKDNGSNIYSINTANFEAIRSNLIGWYEEVQRKLPWRESRNPYHIWISEIMLQQTQVETVVGYYRAFIERFPTIEALAEAEEDDIYKAWEGLGYYSRAKNLHRAAVLILDRFGGKMPERYEDLLSLPGIGPYTAGAVASIAFNQPVPAVDGNVMRVFSRLFNLHSDIALPGTKKLMNEIGSGLVSKAHPASFNQGLMELGALICTPLSPKCLQCPLQHLCEARGAGCEQQLPVKRKKERQKEVVVEAALVRKENKILIVKRPVEGLLANLWAFPAVLKDDDQEDGNSICMELEASYNMKSALGEYLGEKTHIFTHIKWRLKLYGLTLLREGALEYPEIRWVNGEELKKYALPTAFKKLLDYVMI